MLPPILLTLATGLVESDGQCGSQRPVLRLVLIRHAESRNNVKVMVSYAHYRQSRDSDPPLTALGQEQAEALAKFLSGGQAGLMLRLTELHVSPALRTLETAVPIAR